MSENLDATGWLMLAEHAMKLLAERVGRPEAKGGVEAAAASVLNAGRPLRQARTRSRTEAATARLAPAGWAPRAAAARRVAALSITPTHGAVCAPDHTSRGPSGLLYLA